MLGNDVVDLADPEARAGALHPRFDRRVLDAEEQLWLETRPQPERDRWVLWAAKESAYKAARRLDPSVVFAPARFAVRLQPRPGGFAGHVFQGERRLRVCVAVEARYVHALCLAEPWECGTVLAAVRVFPGRDALEPRAASVAVRVLARASLARALRRAPGSLAFGRSGRLPLLVVGGRRSEHPLSFSHHGRCAAFAAVLA